MTSRNPWCNPIVPFYRFLPLLTVQNLNYRKERQGEHSPEDKSPAASGELEGDSQLRSLPPGTRALLHLDPREGRQQVQGGGLDQARRVFSGARGLVTGLS